MPEIFINGHEVQAEDGQTVMQAARANGHQIPAFCWHPQLSAPGNCRVCVVEVRNQQDSDGWVDIACNMPVSAGMRVLTDSPKVLARRQETLQFVTLNHPVDCGICDKAGECTLQDYHYLYNGAPSISREPKVHATKHYGLSERIVLDNERCILCTRCVRFTSEISKSHALGVQQRGDHSLIRPVEDGAFERDVYSDNVIDICPVGALLSTRFLHQARVWYLQATPSICPGCERGCTIDIWHRKDEWKYKALDPRRNTKIERVTPRQIAQADDQSAGPWVCNKARDLADIFERPRAVVPLLKGQAVALDLALDQARWFIAHARHAVALVSSWASNEELMVFKKLLGPHFESYVKVDQVAAPGEVIEDDFLIRPDKNPNNAGARALFTLLPPDPRSVFSASCDLVLVWGEGCDFTLLPAAAQVIQLSSWQHVHNDRADVFLPISVMTERSGHYTNVEGKLGYFEACFAKPPGVQHAADLFAALIAALDAALVAKVAEPAP